MPFTFDDLERIEIEKEKNRQKIIKRNRKIACFVLTILIGCIFFTIAYAIGRAL